MAYLLEDYNILCKAIAQGVSVVEFADKKTQFRSLAEMYQIKRDMEKDLGITIAGQPARKFSEFSKGL